MPVTQHVVRQSDSDQRLDRWFKQKFPALGHGRLEKLLRTGQIRVDGKRVKAAHRLSSGETIRVPPMEASAKPTEAGKPSPGGKPASARKPAAVTQADLSEDRAFLESITLFRDDTVLALNKPAGLAVQGGTGQKRNLDAMLEALTRKGERPRLVHRLDKDTSGVLLIGLTRRSAASLASAFRGRDVKKLYWSVVVGTPARRRGFIDLSLAKRGGPAGERVIIAEDVETGAKAEDAQQARTRYAVVDHAANKVTWLAMMPLTGRTHQLRAHATAIGAPILGDGKYGGSDAFLNGLPRKLHLHARRLIAPHPGGGWIDVEATLPPHMLETFDTLGFDAKDDEDPFELSGR